MGGPEHLVFDFDTNTWVQQDVLSAQIGLSDSHLDAPATPPTPGRWLRPTKPDAAKGRTALAVGGAIVLVAIAIAFDRGVLLAPAIVLTILGAVISDSELYSMRAVTEKDRRLIEDPDDLDVCLVGLEIVRDGRSVGRDKGVVWFADGLLLYSGHRTSFAIGGEDVLPPDEWEGLPNRSHDHRSDLRVPLLVERGTAYVELTPLIDKKGSSPQEMRFLKRLYAFRLRPPLSQGPRQWPPLEP